MFLLTIVALWVLTDVYSFFGVKQLIHAWPAGARTTLNWLWWLPTLITLVLIINLFFNREKMMHSGNYTVFFITIGMVFIFLLPKVLFSVFHLISDGVNLARSIFSGAPEVIAGEPETKISRIQFFNQVGIAASALMLGSMLYGVTRGKYAFRILSEKISFPDLPTAFHGTRIVQLSDMHLGSFQENGFEEIQTAVQRINDLEPDYILFTGDMVNFFSKEAEPWISTFSGLKAKHGKFSVLGNHDYGDYADWFTRDEKIANLENLKSVHHQMGFDLLLNSNRKLEKDGEHITLLGMENWGDGFAKYGNLPKTMTGVDPDSFKILMSHDPTHWELQVMGKEKIHLTLAGHTHGAQFGLELPALGIKFSPSEIRYKRWGGLYKEFDQYLYVNRGFGFIAFPGRVGMPPEITCIDLERA